MDPQVNNVSTFPPPPFFYKLYARGPGLRYTPPADFERRPPAVQEVARFVQQRSGKEEADEDGDEAMDGGEEDASEDRVHEPLIVADVDILKPPAPPSGPFSKFGQIVNMKEGFESIKPLHCRELYPSDKPLHEIDVVGNLRRLNRLTATHFTELLGILTSPEGVPPQVNAKVEDMGHVFFNISHLLNRVRAHQARQALITVLRDQVQRRRQAAEKLEVLSNEIRTYLQHHAGDGDDPEAVEPQPAAPVPAGKQEASEDEDVDMQDADPEPIRPQHDRDAAATALAQELAAL